jgi:hypothetical protein
MYVVIFGRVQEVRRHKDQTYTRIVCPAEDAYSRPQVVEVRSKRAIGRRDDEIEVTCKLGGYTRAPFRMTDKETGETMSVIPVDLTLDVQE